MIACATVLHVCLFCTGPKRENEQAFRKEKIRRTAAKYVGTGLTCFLVEIQFEDVERETNHVRVVNRSTPYQCKYMYKRAVGSSTIILLLCVSKAQTTSKQRDLCHLTIK